MRERKIESERKKVGDIERWWEMAGKEQHEQSQPNERDETT